MLQAESPSALTLIDVRDPDEYSEWSIPGSTNLPLTLLLASAKRGNLSRNKHIVTICERGIRSAEASKQLRAFGFNTSSLEGGMVGWSHVYDVAPMYPDGGFKVYQVRRLGKGCVSYLIASGDEGAVIDPTIHTEKFISIAEEDGAKIRHVLDTHLHADHVSGASALAAATGANVHKNAMDGYEMRNFEPLSDGQEIQIGETILRAYSTPGHTKGSTSFMIGDKYLITGDSLFLEAIARPDLHEDAEEYAKDLYDTYNLTFTRFPDASLVLPAHFSNAVNMHFGRPSTGTLSNIRGSLPIMGATEEEFMRVVLRFVAPKPPNHLNILEINKKGEGVSPEEAEDLEEGPNRCALVT